MTGQAVWRKSSYSDESGTNCVEVAESSVRDSKNPGPVLVFPAAEWKAFLSTLKEV